MSAPRVLITRSPHQASALADQLRARGVEPILIPTIELADPTTFAPLDAALVHLDTFHWLIFTSANAVEAFAKRAVRPGVSHTQVPQGFSLGSHSLVEEGALAPKVCLPSGVKIAAIGPATARALEAASLPIHLQPPQAIAESLTEALLPHSLQPDGTSTRFLLLRAESARELLPDTLRAAGADITIAPVYRNIVPADSIDAIRNLFSTRERWPDAITFTSSSTATNLIALLETASLTLPSEIPRISIGPITSQTLRDLNLTPHAEATEPNLPSLVAAVVKTLNLPESTQIAHSKREKTFRNLA